jgi:peptidoglycan/xylan/chitin deacetylase (PgdA/CDA1 family)
MGRSIFRIFQRGFLRKVLRTKVASHYDLKSLLHGTLLPAPHLGRKYGHIMRRVRDMGFEVGIHAHDHYRWQNYVHTFSLEETRAEFGRAVEEFERIFGCKPTAAGAPGWQANADSLAVYDESGLEYASDTRGTTPFLPVMNGQVFGTPQLPTTLPTLDELLGRPEFPLSQAAHHYLELLRSSGDHVLTVHAEMEGRDYANFFEDLILQAKKAGVEFYSLGSKAKDLRAAGLEKLPRCELTQRVIPGRSGRVAVQGPA